MWSTSRSATRDQGVQTRGDILDPRRARGQCRRSLPISRTIGLREIAIPARDRFPGSAHVATAPPILSEMPATSETPPAQSIPAAHRALYRRFRAQTFGQMVGQSAVVETLRNAVRLGRLGHGFLFVGPRGTGKTSTARILAKAVNCLDLQDGEPCDRCLPCVAIREGRALDVIELDAASNNRVDDMRELLPRVYTSASDLRRKVFIIDEVQRIKEGWDVLLKTLEEPPDGVVFIFCTTDPSQIRPAVVSRLQRFTFRPLSSEEIQGKLERILDSEGRSAEPEALALIAQLAAGGMRDAESLLDQVLSNADDPITAAGIRDLLGLAQEAAVERFIEALARGDALAGITVRDELEAEGRDVVAFTEQVVVRLRSLLVERMSGRGIDATGGGVAELARAARRLTGLDASRSGLGGYRWQLELALLASAAPAVPGGTQDVIRPATPAELAASAARSTSPAPATSPAASRMPARPATPPTAPRPPARPRDDASPVPVARAAAPPLAADDVLDRLRRGWQEVIAYVGRNPANRPIVNACRPVEVREGVVVLGFPEDQAFLRDHGERKRAALEEGIGHVLGRAIGVRCIVANVELGVSDLEAGADLVSQARLIFGGDLADVGEIS